MENKLENIIKKIKNYIPKDDDWFDLEGLIEELFSFENPVLGLDAMIGLYERYPDEDNDVLWGMLHGIEGIDNSEMKVIESVKRKPSFFCVLMINRILNAGIKSIENIDLLNVLKISASNPDTTVSVREQSQRFINRHSE